MGKIRTRGLERKHVGTPAAVPEVRRIRIEAILDRAHQGVLDLALESGLQVLAAMLEEDRERLCGPKSKPDQFRQAYRHGKDEAPVVMGGRKVRVAKPRVRDVDGEEIPLPTWEWATREDPLQERTLQQLLVGVSTRGYARSLEPPPPGVEDSVSVSRSSVSRRFIARTQAQVDEFLSRPLGELDIPIVMIDGTWLGDHLLLVAQGIDASGQKHVLGVEHRERERVPQLVQRAGRARPGAGTRAAVRD